MLVELTTVAILAEDLDIIKAFERAWGILTGDLGSVALMTLILYLGRMIIGIITILPIFLVIAPAVLGMVSDNQSRNRSWCCLVSGVALMIYIVLAIFLNSVVEAYLGTAWTLVFRRLTGHGGDEITADAEDAPQEPSLPEAAAA